MRENDWRLWQECLPSDPQQLNEFHAELERQVKLTEVRLADAIWQATCIQERRALHMKLDRLTCIVLLVEATVNETQRS